LQSTGDLEVKEIEGEDPYLFTWSETIVEDMRRPLFVEGRQSLEVRAFGSRHDFLLRSGG